MRCTSARRRPTPSRKALRIHHAVERLAVARRDLDRFRIGEQPVDDELAVPHVVFFDLRPFANPPQLHQRVTCVGLVFREDDFLQRVGADDPDLDEVGIGDEIQRDEIGARLFDGRELLLQRLLGRAVQERRDQARSVADDLVQVRRQLRRERAPALGAERLRPRSTRTRCGTRAASTSRRPRRRSRARPTCCRSVSRIS